MTPKITHVTAVGSLQKEEKRETVSLPIKLEYHAGLEAQGAEPTIRLVFELMQSTR
jgi:hypothetical protein